MGRDPRASVQWRNARMLPRASFNSCRRSHRRRHPDISKSCSRAVSSSESRRISTSPRCCVSCARLEPDDASGSTRIFVCTRPVDLRKSFDGLAKCTREILERDPASALFLFTGRRATSLTALWDVRILHFAQKAGARVFRMPTAVGDATSLSIDARELTLILEGIELPTRKKRAKSAARDGRTKASRAIESLSTDHGA
jgi:transposase